MFGIGAVELAIIMTLGLPVIVVLCVFGLGALAIWRDSGKKGLSEEETRLIQELHHGFEKLEERVETLETLLVDREKGARPV